MRILFAHQNFPAQFGGFGAYLARNGWQVTFMAAAFRAEPPDGCRVIEMKPHRSLTPGVHRFATSLENAMINGQAFANAAIKARTKGFFPDVVVAHSGWGSGTFAKAVWPECRYVPYVEWYYRWPPVDSVGADPKRTTEDGRAHALARNAPVLLDLAEADLVFCPTSFQAAQFPPRYRKNMLVLHDGVDAEALAPRPTLRVSVEDGGLPADAELVTYATRGMEPHRGFPEFMRAIALLQKSRPRLHAIIGGEDRVAYGPKLPAGDSWKKRMLKELELDLSRIHFVGILPKADYTRLLQSTHVHVYLSVPFVLSWSVIEAMSIACPLVVSDTEPVREALQHDVSAEMVNHRDVETLAHAIERLLTDRQRAARLGDSARQTVLKKYDARWIWPARANALRQLLSHRM